MEALKLSRCWIKSIIPLALTILIFNSCKKELLTSVAEENSIVTQSDATIITTINYNDFLKKVNLNNIGKVAEVFKANPSNAVLGMGNLGTGSPELEIETSNIKELKAEGHISYVFPIKLSSKYVQNFSNLTIDIKGDTVKAFINTYKPSLEWIKDWRLKRAGKFIGEVTYTAINHFESATTKNATAIMTTQDHCIDWQEYYLIPNQCQGPPYHWPDDDRCSLFGQLGGAYYTVGSITKTQCTYGGGGGEGSGNNQGGGGSSNTTPNPPPGYDPCDQPPSRENPDEPPCENAPPLYPDAPDYSYDPTYQHLPNRSESVFNTETAQYYTYGQIEDYYNDNPDAVEELFAGNEIPQTVITVPMWGLTNMQHIAQESIYLKAINPSWSNLKIASVATWNVLGGTFHFALDLVGMVPVYGEAADILNGAIYYLEGNYIDAALSTSAAIPVWGWVSTGGKWLRKASTQLTKPVSVAAGKVAYMAVKNSKGVVRFIKVAVSNFNHGAVTALKAVKPADNTLTNLSRTMIDQLSLRIKPTAQSLKNKVDDIVQNGDAVGTKTEQLADEMFATNGFVKHEAKIGSNNGFDGVYIKKDGAGNVQEIIINEAKQVGNAGNIKLNAANSNTGLQAQMSDAWVNQTIDKLKNHPDYSTLGNLLFNNKSTIKKTVTGVDRASGDIVVLKLSAY